MKNIALYAVVVFGFTACSFLDVVAKGSALSLAAVLEIIPARANFDDGIRAWSLVAPDASAIFVWSTGFDGGQHNRALIAFDATPFINAGLDARKLPDSITITGNTFIIADTFNIVKSRTTKKKSTALESYKYLIKASRKNLNYHGAMDHYGISLNDGNMFEWAKDMKTNDKDIVFVLNPAPFIAAGVDPYKIDGWIFTKVPVDDENGKPVEVDKILKLFNLF